PQAMLQRLEKTDAELHRIFSDIRNRSAWDDTFVDALCEPAETFTFGGVFAHIMTFNAHRRLMALDALRQLGVPTEGFGDPMEYEEAWRPGITGYFSRRHERKPHLIPNSRSRSKKWSDDENGLPAFQRRCRAGSCYRCVDESACRCILRESRASLPQSDHGSFADNSQELL